MYKWIPLQNKFVSNLQVIHILWKKTNNKWKNELAKEVEDDTTRGEADDIIPFSGTSACFSVTDIVVVVSSNVKAKLNYKETFPS